MTKTKTRTWPDWVSHHLARLKMSKAELARQIGVTPQRASAISRATNLMTDTVKRVEKVFKVKYPN